MRMEWMTGGRRFGPYTLYDSRDGVHWRARRDRHTGAMADRSTFFLNPLRSPPQWTLSLRENLCAVRVRVRVRVTLTLTLTQALTLTLTQTLTLTLALTLPR